MKKLHIFKTNIDGYDILIHLKMLNVLQDTVGVGHLIDEFDWLLPENETNFSLTCTDEEANLVNLLLNRHGWK